MTGKFTFSKKERLFYHKHIDSLFSGGSSFILHPLKVYYLKPDLSVDPTSRVLITVPRRKFKRAVDRNRLRRLIREAYRLNRHLLQDFPVQLHIGFVYIGNTVEISYREMESRIIACLDRLVKETGGGG